MFQREELQGKTLGYSFLHEHVFFFFGARIADRSALTQTFPEYEFSFLKQVHSRDVVEANPLSEPEADAQWTRRATRAAAIQTADCVPILLASKYQVCAVHAGWRGVADNIVAAAQSCFQGDPVLFAAIGPHILRQSFEVGQDVADRLNQASPTSGMNLSTPIKNSNKAQNKAHFDLTRLVRAQLRASFGETLSIFECLFDTKTNLEFHSFRRDGAEAGRQYSFVVLNS